MPYRIAVRPLTTPRRRGLGPLGGIADDVLPGDLIAPATGASPAITLSLSPSSTTLTQGSTTSTTVTVTRLNGFAGAVTVSVAGLPSGVTAGALTLGAGVTSGTLTLSATAGAATGAVSATVSGAGAGISTASATLALTVTAAGTGALRAPFSVTMEALPADQTLAGASTRHYATLPLAPGAAAATDLPTYVRVWDLVANAEVPCISGALQGDGGDLWHPAAVDTSGDWSEATAQRSALVLEVEFTMPATYNSVRRFRIDVNTARSASLGSWTTGTQTRDDSTVVSVHAGFQWLDNGLLVQPHADGIHVTPVVPVSHIDASATAIGTSLLPLPSLIPWTTGAKSFVGPRIGLADSGGTGIRMVIYYRPSDATWWCDDTLAGITGGDVNTALIFGRFDVNVPNGQTWTPGNGTDTLAGKGVTIFKNVDASTQSLHRSTGYIDCVPHLPRILIAPAFTTQGDRDTSAAYLCGTQALGPLVRQVDRLDPATGFKALATALGEPYPAEYEDPDDSYKWLLHTTWRNQGIFSTASSGSGTYYDAAVIHYRKWMVTGHPFHWILGISAARAYDADMLNLATPLASTTPPLMAYWEIGATYLMTGDPRYRDLQLRGAAWAWAQSGYATHAAGTYWVGPRESVRPADAAAVALLLRQRVPTDLSAAYGSQTVGWVARIRHHQDQTVDILSDTATQRGRPTDGELPQGYAVLEASDLQPIEPNVDPTTSPPRRYPGSKAFFLGLTGQCCQKMDLYAKPYIRASDPTLLTDSRALLARLYAYLLGTTPAYSAASRGYVPWDGSDWWRGGSVRNAKGTASEGFFYIASTVMSDFKAGVAKAGANSFAWVAGATDMYNPPGTPGAFVRQASTPSAGTHYAELGGPESIDNGVTPQHGQTALNGFHMAAVAYLARTETDPTLRARYRKFAAHLWVKATGAWSGAGFPTSGHWNFSGDPALGGYARNMSHKYLDECLNGFEEMAPVVQAYVTSGG